MAAHSSVLAWETPWTKELGGLQSMWFQRVGYDLATKQQQQIAFYSYFFTPSVFKTRFIIKIKNFV